MTIRDQQTREPIEFVLIYAESPNINTTTNSDGQARIDAFAESDLIYIRRIGYKSASFSFAELSASTIIYLEPDKLDLDNVVISATRWESEESRIPEKITSISPENAARFNPQTAADLLGISGEVFIQKSQQGGGSPMIRGFGANRLLYSIDGIRMNTAIFRSGNLQQVISLDPLTMEGTEVVFGPGAVMYGSDAIGAVMAFETRKPRLSVEDEPFFNGNAFVRYASANFEKTIHLLSETGGRRWSGITSLRFTDYDDMRMGAHGPEEFLRPWYVQRIEGQDQQVTNSSPQIQAPTGYHQWNLMQKIRFRPSNQWDFQYGFHYSTTSDYDRYDRLVIERNGLPRSAEWYYGPQQWMMNALEIQNTAARTFYNQAIFRVAHQYFGESRNDRDYNGDLLRKRDEKVHAVSINSDFRKFYSTRTKLHYGIEWVYNRVGSEGSGVNILNNDVVPIAARYPISNWHSLGIYGLLEHAISDQTDVQLGARYNYFHLYSDFTDNQPFFPLPESTVVLSKGGFAANAGMVHRTGSGGEIRLHLSTGFRAPNVDDIGKVFDSEPGAVVVPNSDLSPEYAYNAEAGIGQLFWDNLRFEITGYVTLLNSAMVRRDFTFNGMDSIMYDGTFSKVQAIQNVSSTLVYGTQIGIEAVLLNNWNISARMNIQEGTDRIEGEMTSPTRHAAPLYGIASLSRSFSQWEIMFYTVFSGSINYEDMPPEEIGKPYLYAKDVNGNPYSPGWYTLNLKGSYQFKKILRLNFGLENISNQRYRTYSSGLAAPGINVITSVNITF